MSFPASGKKKKKAMLLKSIPGSNGGVFGNPLICSFLVVH